MKSLTSYIFKPIPALLLYVLYIITLQFLKLYIDETLGYAIMIWLGLLLYIYLILYLFKSIFRASNEKISIGNAVLNIVIAALAGVVFFAVNYFYIYQVSNDNFVGSIGENPIEIFISFLYFSFATFATVGFGDISPISSLAKILSILEIIYSFFIIVIAISGFNQLKEGLKNSKNNIIK